MNPTHYVVTELSKIDLNLLKEGDYFVIKTIQEQQVKDQCWFNGKQFDSAKVTHVCIPCIIPSEENLKNLLKKSLDFKPTDFKNNDWLDYRRKVKVALSNNIEKGGKE